MDAHRNCPDYSTLYHSSDNPGMNTKIEGHTVKKKKGISQSDKVGVGERREQRYSDLRGAVRLQCSQREGENRNPI